MTRRGLFSFLGALLPLTFLRWKRQESQPSESGPFQVNPDTFVVCDPDTGIPKWVRLSPWGRKRKGFSPYDTPSKNFTLTGITETDGASTQDFPPSGSK